MKSNFDTSFEMVLAHEGGYVNDPRDPGGATNMGVTQRAWEEYVGHPVSERSMIALTRDMVKPFYKAKYWDKINGDRLPSGVDHAAFDLAVNSGVSRAARYMQRIAGVPEDGLIGPKSLEAISACPPDEMIDALCSGKGAHRRPEAPADVEDLRTWVADPRDGSGASGHQDGKHGLKVL